VRTFGDASAAILALLAAAVLGAGCSVRPQDRPEPVTTAAPPSVEVDAGNRPEGPRLTVFFVRGAHLAPVTRTTDAATTVSALDLLVEGPTRAEVGTGIRTALAPEVVGVDQEFPDSGATVSVTRGFTGLTGGNQLLAVAQVVWTLTDLPTVAAVRQPRTALTAPGGDAPQEGPVTGADGGQPSEAVMVTVVPVTVVHSRVNGPAETLSP
jgi:hypothetical protein